MSDELDVAELRSELETIKDAMGIRERYPTRFRLWLVYGVLVALAALGSQVVALYDLPWWGHWLSWGVFISLGVLYQNVVLEGTVGENGTGEGKPDIGLQYGAVFAYVLVVLVAIGPAFDGLSDTVASATTFALVTGAIGLAYLLAGNALKAYYIRRRDRMAFYAGGIWMLALAVAIARVPFLQTWGYAVFGLAFGVHAVASYTILNR